MAQARTYSDAIDCLNSIQNIKEKRDYTLTREERRVKSLSDFTSYLQKLGYNPHDLNRLNVIHVAGTKGKGSTSAFTESILRNTRPGWKIGLYTSPHMVAVRERIRISGQPLSEKLFTEYFFYVWDQLSSYRTYEEGKKDMPGYFRFLTLLAFHAFLRENVNATVLEVGVGGTFDSTNIVPKPIVTGITSLGLDHVSVLGHTLEDIAWHKAGIFKGGVPAITTVQPQEALDVIFQRAEELEASNITVATHIPELADIQLGIAGRHQQTNAALAVYLATTFFTIVDPYFRLAYNNSPSQARMLPASFISGLEKTKWPGRCQTIHDVTRPGLSWFLDGAHTAESLDCCLEWYLRPPTTSPREPTRILVFYCTKGRPVETLLNIVYSRISDKLAVYENNGTTTTTTPETYFKHVIFCTCTTYADGQSKGDLTAKHSTSNELRTLEDLVQTWSTLVPSFPIANIHALPSIEHAVQLIDSIRKRPQEDHQHQHQQAYEVLVTGSLHLVGGSIEVAGIVDQALR